LSIRTKVQCRKVLFGFVIGKNVEVGAYCYISANTTIGDDTKIEQSSCIYGKTTIGKSNLSVLFLRI